MIVEEEDKKFKVLQFFTETEPGIWLSKIWKTRVDNLKKELLRAAPEDVPIIQAKLQYHEDIIGPEIKNLPKVKEEMKEEEWEEIDPPKPELRRKKRK